MTLAIRNRGIVYDNWDTAVVERGLERVCSAFSFTSTSSTTNIAIREGDLVTIEADGHKILTGYVDVSNIKYDKDSHSIKITGRSLTQDLVDCSVPALNDFEYITLLNLCKIICSNFNIEVVDTVEPDFDVFGVPYFVLPLRDIILPELGQTAFKFLETYAKSRQVLLTDNENGNLVITRASKQISKNEFTCIRNNFNNNIKAAEFEINLSNLFYRYIATMTGFPINLEEFNIVNIEDWEELQETRQEVIDAQIRDTRVYEFYPEENIEENALEYRARWEMSIRRARNFNYTATVQGHSGNGEVFKDNLLYNIRDDKCNLKGLYLCNRITYKQSLDAGSETTLNFTNKKAYTLQSELDSILLDDEF